MKKVGNMVVLCIYHDLDWKIWFLTGKDLGLILYAKSGKVELGDFFLEVNNPDCWQSMHDLNW
jgi:hypothetical protein